MAGDRGFPIKDVRIKDVVVDVDADPDADSDSEEPVSCVLYPGS